jgi:hypothetical protein
MKKRLVLLSSITVAALLTFNACGSSVTRDDQSYVGADKGGHIANEPSGGFINDDKDKVSLPSKDANTNGSVVENKDENATTGTIKIDAKNAYKVAVTFSDDYNQKGYYSKSEVGELKFNITNIYDKKADITDIIENITLDVEEKSDTNKLQGKYLNFITYDGKQGGTYSIDQAHIKSSDSVALKMEKLSGTTNIILSVKIKDIEKPYKLKVPIVIEKNKSSSMAIVPIGSRYENGLYIDKFVIHVVDSYGNKAQDGTRISTGVINNPKLYSNAYNGAVKHHADKYIVDITKGEIQTYTDTNLTDQELPNSYGKIIANDYSKFQYSFTSPVLDENNTIVKDENNNTVYQTTYTDSYYPTIFGVKRKNDKGTLNKSDGTFTINPVNPTDIITDKITSLDTLIVLANKNNHHPENLGGWDIASIEGPNKLKLVSLDKGTDLSGLTYVIGDEYRYIDRGQTIANGAVSTFETTEVKDGLAFAELRYTPELVGHNVFIYANTRLEDKHIGISRNLLLHGTGQSEKTMSCTNDKGKKPDCHMSYRITLNDSGKGAYKVNIGTPQIVGENTYRYATASRTNATGWTTVSIYGIDENKTATVKFGSLINDEYIINQK